MPAVVSEQLKQQAAVMIKHRYHDECFDTSAIDGETYSDSTSGGVDVRPERPPSASPLSETDDTTEYRPLVHPIRESTSACLCQYRIEFMCEACVSRAGNADGVVSASPNDSENDHCRLPEQCPIERTDACCGLGTTEAAGSSNDQTQVSTAQHASGNAERSSSDTQHERRCEVCTSCTMQRPSQCAHHAQSSVVCPLSTGERSSRDSGLSSLRNVPAASGDAPPLRSSVADASAYDARPEDRDAACMALLPGYGGTNSAAQEQTRNGFPLDRHLDCTAAETLVGSGRRRSLAAANAFRSLLQGRQLPSRTTQRCSAAHEPSDLMDTESGCDDSTSNASSPPSSSTVARGSMFSSDASSFPADDGAKRSHHLPSAKSPAGSCSSSDLLLEKLKHGDGPAPGETFADFTAQTVLQLRAQRMGMVQTAAQYRLLHEACLLGLRRDSQPLIKLPPDEDLFAEASTRSQMTAADRAGAFPAPQLDDSVSR
jgi:hypothetical protein